MNYNMPSKLILKIFLVCLLNLNVIMLHLFDIILLLENKALLTLHFLQSWQMHSAALYFGLVSFLVL